jgi:hypothetical protein
MSKKTKTYRGQRVKKRSRKGMYCNCHHCVGTDRFAINLIKENIINKEMILWITK